MKENFRIIGKTISWVVIITFIGKIIGFFRELLLSYYYGATGISDAYIISQIIPGTIFQFVGTGLITCFIPVFYKVESDKKDSVRFTNKILQLVFIFSIIVILIVWSCTYVIVKAFAYGLEGQALYYAIWFTRIGVLSLFFSSMIYVYNSYLQANKIFVATVLAAIPNSLFIIISIVLSSKFNIWILSIGSTLAVGVQLLSLIPFICKTNYKYTFEINLNDKYIKQFFMLMWPVIIGVSVNEVNTLVDRTIASQIIIGGISSLTYANSLVQFVQSGIVQSVATVCYPQISASVANNNYKEAKALVQNTVIMLLEILIPITAIIMLYSKHITILLFGRGAFSKEAVELTSTALCFYSIGICFYGIREIVSRYYYSNSNTHTPMVNASIGVVCNILLNIFLSRKIGIGGLALATSVSACITSILLIIDSGKKIQGGSIKIDYYHLGKIIIATIVMCIGSYFAYSMVYRYGEIIAFVIASIIAIFIYLFETVVFKMDIIKIFK